MGRLLINDYHIEPLHAAAQPLSLAAIVYPPARLSICSIVELFPTEIHMFQLSIKQSDQNQEMRPDLGTRRSNKERGKRV